MLNELFNNSRLQHELFSFRVLEHVGSQTDSAGAFARRVLTTRHKVVDVLQQLRLAGAWVSTQQNIQFGPKQDNTMNLLAQKR